MTDALRKRLAKPVVPALDSLVVARNDYRAARAKTDLYDEAIKARTYVAQLEQRLVETESRLRARPSRNSW